MRGKTGEGRAQDEFDDVNLPMRCRRHCNATFRTGPPTTKRRSFATGQNFTAFLYFRQTLHLALHSDRHKSSQKRRFYAIAWHDGCASVPFDTYRWSKLVVNRRQLFLSLKVETRLISKANAPNIHIRLYCGE